MGDQHGSECASATPRRQHQPVDGTCSKGVASMGIYVNNKLIYVVDSTSLNTQITLSPGAEHTVVEEWDKCGGASYTTVNLTVQAATTTAVTISANPTTISAGGSSTLTVTATDAAQVTIAGSDGSTYTLAANGGTQVVSPVATTTYTAEATGPQGQPGFRGCDCDGGARRGPAIDLARHLRTAGKPFVR